MPTEMTPDQRRAFVAHGTRMAILASTRADGRPHAVPLWFSVDGDDVLINVGEDTVKGKAIERDPRVTVLVNDETPPYAFVMIEGTAEISRDADEIRAGAKALADRYLAGAGHEAVEGYVQYATGAGKVLVRIRPNHIVALDRFAG